MNFLFILYKTIFLGFLVNVGLTWTCKIIEGQGKSGKLFRVREGIENWPKLWEIFYKSSKSEKMFLF